MRHLPLAVSLIVASSSACAGLNHAPPADPSAELRGHTREGVAPATLRVVTFNVHDQAGDLIAQALQGSDALADADVVLLQEVREHRGCSAACAAADRLGMTSIYAPGHAEGPGTEGVAILSRWPVRDLEIIELPRERVVWNSARRAAVAATIDTAAGPLRVFAVHLDNRLNPAARIRQLAPVLARAASHDGAVLVGGDVNTNPFVWIGHVVPVPAGIQHRRLEHAVRAAGLDTPVAGSGATHQWLQMRLDAIYTRGLRVPRFGVDAAVRISDHLPLWAEIEVRDPGGVGPGVALAR